MKLPKVHARLAGMCFLLSFVSYAAGTALADPVRHAAMSSSGARASDWIMILGGILVTIVHTMCNLGFLVILARTLMPYGGMPAGVYFSLGVVSTVMLALGGVFLMLPGSSGVIQGVPPVLLHLCVRADFYLYQSGMAIWGCGGLMLCFLLLRSRLVPVVFAWCGYAGYLIFIAGTLLELSGYPVGTLMSLPGGLVEIALSLWLIFRGFSGSLKAPVAVAG